MKYIVAPLILLLLPFAVFSQDNFVLEKFQPIPKKVKKISGVQYSIYKQDTTREDFSEYNFDEAGNLIKWEQFLYHAGEEREYDSLGRITELEGVYGESFANGTVSYSYLSKNQKIEIYDKMGFYQYVKSNFVFDKDKIVQEVRYDSTFDKMDNYGSSNKVNISYSYDKYGNLAEELHFLDSATEMIYEMHAIYNKNSLLNRSEHFSEKSHNYESADIKTEEYFYIEEGDFKGKVKKKVLKATLSHIDTKTETIITYTYKKLGKDSYTVEIRHFSSGKLTWHQKKTYNNDYLVKLEEYNTLESSSEPKLSSWTEYTYSFYPTSNE
ncbi:hypothetical protein [Bernardetia sp.]|uniref:hypothetical protein n=1 Tax=Bernardetia sp. TaxID=1937974 RepID=UPI0025C6AF4C|nr:hypothetical protein [Bernardetia sp.]